MRQKPAGRPSSPEQIIKDIKRKTRKQYGAEELSIRILEIVSGAGTSLFKPARTLYVELECCRRRREAIGAST